MDQQIETFKSQNDKLQAMQKECEDKLAKVNKQEEDFEIRKSERELLEDQRVKAKLNYDKDIEKVTIEHDLREKALHDRIQVLEDQLKVKTEECIELKRGSMKKKSLHSVKNEDIESSMIRSSNSSSQDHQLRALSQSNNNTQVIEESKSSIS